ncbi:MAG: primosomal protein N' [Phycisphaerales bacterium]|nr:primosomal protein N' [Phycisphaerales bacterium]
MPNLFATEAAAGYARVAIERGVDRYPDGLTYAIPAESQEFAALKPGDRVVVPLGKGNTATPGYVVELTGSIDVDPSKVKFIQRRDDAAARLPQQLLDLAKWMSSYYCTPIGMTLATMLPAAVKRNVGTIRKTFVDLAEPSSADVGHRYSPKQRRVLSALAALRAHERPVEIRALVELAELKTPASIRRMIQRGILRAVHRNVVEAAWTEHLSDARTPERLTEEQVEVIEAVGERLDKGFFSHLLFGVTGSGKTEVYIRLINRVLERRKVVLMLVPEISLTPQTGGRLIGRFPNHRVAVLHSGLTAAQRHQQWALVADNQADIILGARSAIFAPVKEERLGLIIVDEEHDSSYKQDQAPRYHGRDVAIRRAQLANCPILLGSATPSLESWHNAITGKSSLHRMRHRAPGLRLPKVQLLDFRAEARQRRDNRVHLLGPTLEGAIAQTLDGGGQILILLNRRGYANYIACPSSHCGWIMTCDHCDVTTVYHRDQKLPTGGYVRCHHCLSEQKLPSTCPQCGKKISVFGLGTQRIEEELSRKFPQLIEGQTMLRIDSDSMGGASDFHDALERFGRGEIRLLVGTQMIAKGLDFPGVRLVGVINADTSINLPDFRASERTFQLVSQVAGRCGRGADPGLTLVQTFNPNSSAIRLAANHDYESFATQELAERQRCGLPPITRMARLVIRHEDHVKCIELARRLFAGLRALAQSRFGDSETVGAGHHDFSTVRLRGPAPCPIARIADKHRQQIEVLTPSAALMQSFLTEARKAGLLKAGAEMAIDVDPLALL